MTVHEKKEIAAWFFQCRPEDIQVSPILITNKASTQLRDLTQKKVIYICDFLLSGQVGQSAADAAVTLYFSNGGDPYYLFPGNYDSNSTDTHMPSVQYRDVCFRTASWANTSAAVHMVGHVLTQMDPNE